MAAPKVSVIVPAYNAQRFIAECLDSISRQSCKDIEVIIVDDGSTDSTPDMVRSHAAEDDRIILLEQENKYAGVARNAGLAIARGEYLLFLDADDFFEPSLIEDMLVCAEASSADVVICRSYYYDDVSGESNLNASSLRMVDLDKVYAGLDLKDILFNFCVGWPWDKMFRREFINAHALQFQDTRTTNDAFFVFVALALAERISFVDKPLVFHRVNNRESLENTRVKSWVNVQKAVLAIEERLRREGLFESYERSYLNWLLNYSIWNLFTLDDDAGDAVMAWIEQSIITRLPLEDDSFFLDEENQSIAKLIALRKIGLLKYANDAKWKIRNQEHALSSMETRLHALEETVADDREKIEKLERACREIEESSSYRLGHALLTVPRAIKDSFAKSNA